MFSPFSIAPIHFLVCCRTFYFLSFSIFIFWFLIFSLFIVFFKLFFYCARRRLKNSIDGWRLSLGSLSPSFLSKQTHKHFHHCLLCIVLCASLMCSLVSHCHCVWWLHEKLMCSPSCCCSLLYREEEDVLVFDIIIFFITIIFKWASSQNPFSTFFFGYNVCFFVGSTYFLLCVVLAMFFPLLLLAMCSSTHTNVFPLFFIHHCLQQVIVTWIVNVLVFELNKFTPSPNTFFFVTMCDFFSPNWFFFWLHCCDCDVLYSHYLLHSCARKKRRIQCTSSSF